MKKVICSIVLALILFVSAFPTVNNAYASTKNAVIILSGNIVDEKVVVNVNLVDNPGISAMVLELSFDKDVFTLVNIQRGNALSSLVFDHTGDETTAEAFKVIFEKGNNDYSTGILFTLEFSVAENVKNGNYKIGLTYKRDKDVNYINDKNEIDTRNLSIDAVEIKIQNSQPVEIETVSLNAKKHNVTRIVVCSVATGLLVVTGVIAIVYFLQNKKRHWKKL